MKQETAVKSEECYTLDDNDDVLFEESESSNHKKVMMSVTVSDGEFIGFYSQ